RRAPRRLWLRYPVSCGSRRREMNAGRLMQSHHEQLRLALTCTIVGAVAAFCAAAISIALGQPLRATGSVGGGVLLIGIASRLRASIARQSGE
ncbi:MAG: hypothetical protein NDJ92_12210, partial [Thermoanaerobaculia bacterium]|nr:hypothetical protein [Thermoanaerobaculia bacterium]